MTSALVQTECMNHEQSLTIEINQHHSALKLAAIIHIKYNVRLKL